MKAQLIAFATGVCAHLVYWIRGEHLTNVPSLLLLAVVIFGVSVTGLHIWASLPLLPAILSVSRVFAAHLFGLSFSITVYRAFFHRLRHISGPFGARLSKFYHVYAVRRLDQYRWLNELHQQYGPVVRIGE